MFRGLFFSNKLAVNKNIPEIIKPKATKIKLAKIDSILSFSQKPNMAAGIDATIRYIASLKLSLCVLNVKKSITIARISL
jgi:hypothetical protein